MLVTSALRIYLVHSLSQTEDFIRVGRQNLSTRFFQNGKVGGACRPSQWTAVLKAANSVIDCIRTCQGALDGSARLAPSFFCILSAVEACQDSLNEAKKASQCFVQDDFDRCVIFSEKHFSKATYLTNAFEAIQRDDHNLTELWLLAAKNMTEDIELKLEAPYLLAHVQILLKKAQSEDVIIAQHKSLWSETRVRLHQRALHHFRHAAAMSALDKTHSHEDAAAVYLKASALHERISRARSPEIAILEQAATKLSMAMVLIEQNADNDNFAHSDSAIQSLVDAADRILIGAHRVGEFATAIEARKAELASTVAAKSKCHDAEMLSVWRVLHAEQEEALTKSESCLHDVMRGKVDLFSGLQQMLSIGTKVKLVADTVDEIHSCRKRAVYYTQRATLEALPGTRLSILSSACWENAAMHMDAAAQVCVDLILRKTYQKESLDQTPEWQSHCDWTRMFLVMVEYDLVRAGEYCHKARGAEMGVKNGRDPREAQMWRKAAECLLHKAELVLEDDNSDDSSSVSEDPDKETDLEEMIRIYSQSAEYFYLAFRHKMLPDADIRQNGARVAAMYEHWAVLESNKLDIEKHDAVTNAAIDFYRYAIDQLNLSAVLSAERLARLERGGKYAMLACNPSSDSECAARHWRGAFLLTKHISKASEDTPTSPVIIIRGLIALHVCAAEATLTHAIICYEACISELSSVVKLDPGLYRPPDRLYKLALIARMIHSLGPESFVVPPDLQGVLDLASGHEYRSSLLDDHAQALLLKAKCLLQLESLTDQELQRARWEEAYSATIDLCQAYTLCSIERPMGQNSPRLLSYLAYRKAVAQRFVAKAEQTMHSSDIVVHSDADANEAEIVEWPETTVGTTINNTIKIRMALIAVEQYTWAAEQAEYQAANGHQRNKLFQTFGKELRLSAEAAQKCALCPTDEYTRYGFEGDALSTIQLLRQEGENVAAYSIYWGK